MQTTDKLCIEQECCRLVKLFALYSDGGRFAELAELFSDDALYCRPVAPDRVIAGRQAILDSFLERPADRVTRHLVSNILIDAETATSAKGRCYVTLYSGTAGQFSDKFGLQASASRFVGEYHDSFIKTDQGWKFRERRGSIIFST